MNPLTLNRYLYAGANPATMVDPDGHEPISPACVQHYCPPPTTQADCGAYSGAAQIACEQARAANDSGGNGGGGNGGGGKPKKAGGGGTPPTTPTTPGAPLVIDPNNTTPTFTSPDCTGWTDCSTAPSFTDPTCTGWTDCSTNPVSPDDVRKCTKPGDTACLRLGTAAAKDSSSPNAVKCRSGDSRACALVGLEVAGDTLAIAAAGAKEDGVAAAALLARSRSLLLNAGLTNDDVTFFFKGLMPDVRSGVRAVGSFSGKLSAALGVAGAGVDAIVTGMNCISDGGSYVECGKQEDATFAGDMVGVLATTAFLGACTFAWYVCLPGAVAVGYITSNVSRPIIKTGLDWLYDVEGLTP